MKTTVTIDQDVLALLAELTSRYGAELGYVDKFVQAGLVAEGLLILAGHPKYANTPDESNVVALVPTGTVN